MTRVAFGLLTLACLIPGLILALAGAPQPQRDPGSVQGIVIRGDTGAAIADARVTLSGGPTDPEALQAFLNRFSPPGATVAPPPDGQVDERFIQSLIDIGAARGVSIGYPPVRAIVDRVRAGRQFTTVSDDEGHFEIAGVPPGQYVARAQREDFFGASADAAAFPVTVTSKETREVRLALYPGAVIGGRVVDNAGQPQASATVTAYRVNYKDGFPVLQNIISRTADDRGEYRLFWLPPGDYLVSAAPRSFAAPRGEPGARGAIVSAAQVASMKEQSATTFFPGTTDPGSATAVVVPRSGEVSGIDFGLRKITPVKLAGRIQYVRGGATTAGIGTTAEIMLLVRDSNTPEPDVLSEARIVGTTTLTAGTGTFEIAGILPGAYDIYARVPFDAGAPSTYGHAPIDVQGRDITGINIPVYPQQRVSGTVSVDGHAPGTVAVRITLEPEDSAVKIPLYRNIAARPVVAATDGAFAIPGVLPGRFRLDAGKGLAPELYVADILQGGGSIFDAGFEVAAEPPAPIQIVVQSGAATLDGTVHNSAGKPQAGAGIVLVPLNRRQNRALYATTISDGTGRFSIRSIAPGFYKVFAWEEPPASGAYFNARFLSRYEERGQTVNLAQGATQTVNIAATAPRE